MALVRKTTELDEYAPYVGSGTVDRVRQKAKEHAELHVAHVSSTYYGGAVADVLASLTLLMNREGVKTGWRTIQGAPDFFSVTKRFQNALQGQEINLTDLKKSIYEKVVYENSLRNHLERHDIVIVHDTYPLPLVGCYRQSGPWIWRCHLDLTEPYRECWEYLKGFLHEYELMVVSLDEYQRPSEIPQATVAPAIDPFTIKNRKLSEGEIQERLDYYEIPTDLPIVTQISNFEQRKNPVGAIRAFRRAQREVDATLVLLGNVATDDPEGENVYRSLLSHQDERVIVISREDTALVNALQSRAAVVLQMSRREAFGHAVTEAMWKEAAVVGMDVSGIRHQIVDGENGLLVRSVEEAAENIVRLMKDGELRKRLGAAARESVRRNHLMIRLMEDYLDLFSSFETEYRIPEENLERLRDRR